MLGPRRFLGALRGQLDRLFDAVEDREGRVDGILRGLDVRLRQLRSEREPLRRRIADLQRGAELTRLRERQQRSLARQALPDQARALECLRRARLAAGEAEVLSGQTVVLQRTDAALGVELDALERRVAELDALREQLRAREAVVELDALRRATLADADDAAAATSAGSLPALLARWEARVTHGEIERDVAELFDVPDAPAGPSSRDPDAELERELRAELAQLLEEP